MILKERSLKRIVLAVVFLILILVIVSAKYVSDQAAIELTGKEWLKAQEKYMAEFEVFADDIDSVMTLYLENSIGEEDFFNHLDILEQELDVMQATYQKEKEEHPVQTGSHTYATKKGSESVEECYVIFQDLLSMMENNYQDKEALGYKYLAYHQDIIHSVADYMAAKEMVFGESEGDDE